MKSKNIEKELEELNKKFDNLEIEYRFLREKHSRDNRKLRERIVQLEEKNIDQETQLKVLRTTSLKSERKGSSTKQTTRESINLGDVVKVINNYKGQYGTVGKVYNITKEQVHLTDIKTGVSITRAFRNVQVLTLSDKEKDNLFRK